jgi:hypothetical protein
LPGLKRIPIRVLFPAFVLLGSKFGPGLACGFAGRSIPNAGVGLFDHFFFKFELALDLLILDSFVPFGLVQVQVSSEFIFIGNGASTFWGS